MAKTRKVLSCSIARFFICPLNVPTSSLNETFFTEDRYDSFYTLFVGYTQDPKAQGLKAGVGKTYGQNVLLNIVYNSRKDEQNSELVNFRFSGCILRRILKGYISISSSTRNIKMVKKKHSDVLNCTKETSPKANYFSNQILLYLLRQVTYFPGQRKKK